MNDRVDSMVSGKASGKPSGKPGGKACGKACDETVVNIEAQMPVCILLGPTETRHRCSLDRLGLQRGERVLTPLLPAKIELQAGVVVGELVGRIADRIADRMVAKIVANKTGYYFFHTGRLKERAYAKYIQQNQ
jgi:hypothetical protein